MSPPRWKPAVTVAAVCEHAGSYLLVEEETPEGLRLNTPAGHLDPGESPVEAVVREMLEETARPFTPEFWLGAYMTRFLRLRGDEGPEDVTYLRLAFAGQAGAQIAERSFDAGIVRTLWMTPEELRACKPRHRSPLVLCCIEDHLAGKRLPLSALHIDASVYAPLLRG